MPSATSCACHAAANLRGAAPAFTERQVEVLQCASNGLSNKAIARELGVTERTVKDHLTVVYLRLGACNRAEAVARASAMGLVHVQG